MSGKTFDPMGRGAAFGWTNRLERALWQTAWLLLARWTPPPLFGWRRFILRLFGAHIGDGVRIYASTRIWLPRHLACGEGVIVGPHVRLYNQGHIAIRARSVISQYAHLCASTHDVRDPGFALVTKPIVIGEGCWVAADAFVGPGVTMETGAVLGARAALFDRAEADGIYRGNPAVHVATRNWNAG